MAFEQVLLLGNDAEGFSAADDRWLALGQISEGVLPLRLGDVRDACAVTQRGIGANFSVDVASGWVIVEGTHVANQGAYAAYNSATLNVPHALAPNASFPRIDMLVVEVNDSEHTADSPADTIQAVWVYGTATAGATLDNRSGAAAVPATAYHLADVLVSPGDTTITNAAIREKRVPAGPLIHGEDGKAYRLGVDASGLLGLEEL